MSNNKKKNGGITVPSYHQDYYEQIAIWSRLAKLLCDTYGPTKQVMEIIHDCSKYGYPKRLFDINQAGGHPGGENPGKRK